jgi:hypothetical protein
MAAGASLPSTVGAWAGGAQATAKAPAAVVAEMRKKSRRLSLFSILFIAIPSSVN